MEECVIKWPKVKGIAGRLIGGAEENVMIQLQMM